MSNANLCGAWLCFSHFNGANFTSADLRGADLGGATEKPAKAIALEVQTDVKAIATYGGG